MTPFSMAAHTSCRDTLPLQSRTVCTAIWVQAFNTARLSTLLFLLYSGPHFSFQFPHSHFKPVAFEVEDTEVISHSLPLCRGFTDSSAWGKRVVGWLSKKPLISEPGISWASTDNISQKLAAVVPLLLLWQVRMLGLCCVRADCYLAKRLDCV